MKRIFRCVALIPLLVFTSCSSADAKDPEYPETRVEIVTDWAGGSYESEGYREIRINGRTCIESRHVLRSGGAGGISCDWKQG